MLVGLYFALYNAQYLSEYRRKAQKSLTVKRKEEVGKFLHAKRVKKSYMHSFLQVHDLWVLLNKYDSTFIEHMIMIYII